MGIPVLIPGSTMRGLRWKYFWHKGSRMLSMGGTTQEMMIPVRLTGLAPDLTVL